MSLAEDILDALVETYAPREADFEQWDLDALKREVTRVFAVDTDDARLRRPDRRRDPRCALGAHRAARTTRRNSWSAARCCERVERDIMLQIVDAQWKDHLYSLDHLKEGIGLRGYGQRDPLVEYKKESFELFQAMKERVDEEIVRYLWWLRPVLEPRGGVAAVPPRARAAAAPPLILNDPVAEPQSRVRRARRRAGAAPPAAVGAPRRSSRRASAATTPCEDRAARRAEGRPQRPVPVRQREEVQEVPRRRGIVDQPIARDSGGPSGRPFLHGAVWN